MLVQNPNQRRYDIDALRVIAVVLLILYHAAIALQPWAEMIAFLPAKNTWPQLWDGLQILNIWRIPLLFLVSGMACFFVLHSRSVGQLIGERSLRILLPACFATLCLAPIHFLIFQTYLGQSLAYWPHPSHVWFLFNIYLYVLLFAALFAWLKRQQQNAWWQRVQAILSSTAGFYLLWLPFIVAVVLVQPENFSNYVLNWHGLFYGACAFVVGFLIMLCGQGMQRRLQQGMIWHLAAAFLLYLLRFVYFEFNAPNFLIAIESVFWLMAVLALAQQFLSRPRAVFRWLSPAVYPIYLVHMIPLYAIQYYLLQTSLSPVWVWLISMFFTLLVCIGFYLIIRPIKYVRLLFGLK